MLGSVRLLLLAVILAVLLYPGSAQAYIGPGAGFALAGSFLAVLAAMMSALLLVLIWPAKLLWRAVFGRRFRVRGRYKRVVILGLDGLDYGLTERMLAEGKLPHLAAAASKDVSSRWGPHCLPSRRWRGPRFRPARTRANITFTTSSFPTCTPISPR